MAVHIASTHPHASLDRGLRRFCRALDLEAEEADRLVAGALGRARRLMAAASEHQIRAFAYGLVARRFLEASRRAGPPGPRLAPPPQDDVARRSTPVHGPCAVRAAAASLPPLERLALLLAAVEGFDYAQGGAVLALDRREFAAALVRARAGLELRLHAPERDPAGRPRARLRLVR